MCVWDTAEFGGRVPESEAKSVDPVHPASVISTAALNLKIAGVAAEDPITPSLPQPIHFPA